MDGTWCENDSRARERFLAEWRGDWRTDLAQLETSMLQRLKWRLRYAWTSRSVFEKQTSMCGRLQEGGTA